MKIRIEDHVKFDGARMAKIALATTDRAQLDLYCVAPGQYQKPHTHGEQDKIYYVLEGAGRFSLGDKEERVSAGEALVAAAGVEHGLFNNGADPLLVLVVVTPPASAAAPPDVVSRIGSRVMRASIMITCLGDMFFPEVGVAMVTLLRRLGVTVEFPQGQTCCGMPLFNSGYHHDATVVAARTVGLFAGAEHVVVPSGSCAWMVKTEYPGLLKDDPALRAAAEALAKKTYELSQFLVDVLGVTSVESSFRGKVAYHDSCHLLRGLGESRAPRTLLKGVKGCELVELPGSDECCGFGGSFSVRLPEVSTAVLDKKLANAEGTGVDCLVACDAGCLMQMGGGLTRRGSRVRAVHLAQILAPEEDA